MSRYLEIEAGSEDSLRRQYKWRPDPEWGTFGGYRIEAAMAAPLHPSSPSERVLRELEAEHRRDADGRSAAWGFLWTLFAFKIATVLIIIYAASGTGESIAVVLATTWYWFIIPAGAIAGPLLIRWRMLKLRRDRERLRAAEWAVDPEILVMPIPVDRHTPPDTPR